MEPYHLAPRDKQGGIPSLALAWLTPVTTHHRHLPLSQEDQRNPIWEVEMDMKRECDGSKYKPKALEPKAEGTERQMWQREGSGWTKWS